MIAILEKGLERLLCGLLGVYQVIGRGLLPKTCRFEPSCSDYAKDCLKSLGLWRGGMLSLYRVLRCHPFAAGGFDPPPHAAEKGFCCG